MKLYFDYGLPFAKLELINGDKKIKLSKVLIDTGSATTIISTETAIGIGLGPQPNDELSLVRGVGGVESVFEKHVEKIVLDTATLNNFTIDVGAMDYGFEIDAIVGMDILEQAKALINFYEMTLTPMI
ncbi:MAG: retropepsin-like aspartic protease [Clostridia bacterium]|nr:retropepsin-like aspartic protease [Clostridia bacterium]